VFEVAFPGVPGTGWERAVTVADLDEVAERVVRLVGVRLVAVVAGKRGHWLQFHAEVAAVGQGECPGAVPVWRSGVGVSGEGPGCLAWRAGSSGQFRQAVGGDRQVQPCGQGGGTVCGTWADVLGGATVVSAGWAFTAQSCARNRDRPRCRLNR
jgi:hypothetical protein